MVFYKQKYFKSQLVVRLQRRLSLMPLNPKNSRQRKARDSLQRKLLEEAKKSGDVSKIDLQEGYF